MDWSKVDFWKGLLDPVVIRIWLVVLLFGIFFIVTRGLIERAFKNSKPKRAKISTLVLIEVIVLALMVAIWKLP